MKQIINMLAAAVLLLKREPVAQKLVAAALQMLLEREVPV